MNHNHELSPPPDQTEPENIEGIVQTETADTTDEQLSRKNTQKIGEKTLKASEQILSPSSEVLSMSQLAENLGVNRRVVAAILRTEGYEDCGVRLGKGTYFTEEEEKRVASFIEDRITIRRLADNLGVHPNDITVLLNTEGYEDCGIRLGPSIYFTEEDTKRVAAFFKDKKNTQQLARDLDIDYTDISALLKTEGYESCGMRLGYSVYFTEEDEKKITAFFKDKKTTKQLARELGADPTDIGVLLKTEGYENCGIRLRDSIYFTEEDEKKITAFFKDKKTTKQLAREYGINPRVVSALLETEGYENCGIRLAKGIYFTEEDEKKITTFFKNQKATQQLAQELGINHRDISTLLETEGYENCGIRLCDSIYFTKEDEEKITAFFKDKKATKQLAQELGVNNSNISDLLKIEGYENCGIRLGGGIYYTEEDEKKITAFFKGKKTTWQLARELGINLSDISVLLNTEGYENCGIRIRDSIYFTKEDEEKITTFFNGKKTTRQLAEEIGFSVGTIDKIAQTHGIQGIRLGVGIYYDEEQQVPEIIDMLEHESPKDSFPETAFRFYLQQAGLKLAGKRFRPDWMKREETGRNLEIDIFIEFDNPPPPGIGIEYDGGKWHQNPEYDASKNNIAAKSGVQIIHIREKGCPPMRDDIPCVIRQDQKSGSLEDCIRQVFGMLHIPLPETGIDVSKKGDRAKILELSGDKEVKSKAYKGIQANDVNRDGTDISKTNAA